MSLSGFMTTLRETISQTNFKTCCIYKLNLNMDMDCEYAIMTHMSTKVKPMTITTMTITLLDLLLDQHLG